MLTGDQVEAGAEDGAFAAEQDAVDRVVACEFVGVLDQRGEHAIGERVALVGAVEDEVGDLIAALGADHACGPVWRDSATISAA